MAEDPQTISEQVRSELQTERTEMQVEANTNPKNEAIDKIIETLTGFNRAVISKSDILSKIKYLGKKGRNPHEITFDDIVNRGLVPLYNHNAQDGIDTAPPVGETEKARKKREKDERVAQEKSILFVPKKIRDEEEIARVAGKILSERQVHAPIPQEFLDKAADERTLSAEQRKALKYMASGKGLTILRGPPGTGKGRVMEALVDARKFWADAGGRNSRLVGTGPTNMVAQKFVEQGIESANRMTFHKAANPKYHIVNTDLLMDEVFMGGTAQVSPIAYKTALEDANSTIGMVGDEKQRGSIKYGGLFGYLKDEHGAFELTENHRQKVDWQRKQVERMAAATNDNRATVIPEILKEYDVRGALTVVESPQTSIGYPDIIKDHPKRAVYSKMVDRFKEAWQENRETLAIAFLRDDVKNLNRLCFDAQIEKDQLAPQHIKTFKVRTQRADEAEYKKEEFDEAKFAPGTRGQFLAGEFGSKVRKETDGHILNGGFFTIHHFEEYDDHQPGYKEVDGEQKVVDGVVRKGTLIVAKLDEKGEDGEPLEVRWDPSKFTDFDQAFATTIDKVQGQTRREVLYLCGRQDGHTGFNVGTSRHTDGIEIFIQSTSPKKLSAAARDEFLIDHGMRLAQSEDRSTSLIYKTMAEHQIELERKFHNANAMDLDKSPAPAREAAPPVQIEEKAIPASGQHDVEMHDVEMQHDAEMHDVEMQHDVEMIPVESVQNTPIRNLIPEDHLDVDMTAEERPLPAETVRALTDSVQGLGNHPATLNPPHNFAQTVSDSLDSSPSESAATSAHPSPLVRAQTDSSMESTDSSMESTDSSMESIVSSMESIVITLSNSLGGLQIDEAAPKEAPEPAKPLTSLKERMQAARAKQDAEKRAAIEDHAPAEETPTPASKTLTSLKERMQAARAKQAKEREGEQSKAILEELDKLLGSAAQRNADMTETVSRVNELLDRSRQGSEKTKAALERSDTVIERAGKLREEMERSASETAQKNKEAAADLARKLERADKAYQACAARHTEAASMLKSLSFLHPHAEKVDEMVKHSQTRLAAADKKIAEMDGQTQEAMKAIREKLNDIKQFLNQYGEEPPHEGVEPAHTHDGQSARKEVGDAVRSRESRVA